LEGIPVVQRVTDLLADLDGKIGADSGSILAAVTAELSRLTAGTCIAVVMDRDPSTSRVVVGDHASPAREAYVERFAASLDSPGRVATAGLFMRVVETSRHVLVPSVSFEEFLTLLTDSSRTYMSAHPLPVPVKTVGLLLVPMRARNAVVGALGHVRLDGAEPPGEEDVPWMQEIADRVAVVLENIRIRAAAHERLERWNAIRNVTDALASSRDVRVILQEIVKQAVAGLRADAADVLRLDPDTGRLVVEASSGFRSASIRALGLALTPQMADQAVISRGGAAKELDSIGQSRRRSLFESEGFKAHRSSPLVARGQFFGVLEIFHRTELEPDQEWIDFVDLMATYAGLAIANSDIDSARSVEFPRHLGANFELNQMQRRILGLVVEGATNQEIGERVYLSESTVKSHVRQILNKVGVTNRTELARRATQLGLV
jgi:DNA-binding CsgD family transcriptional regulator/GAF domain-containing protein